MSSSGSAASASSSSAASSLFSSSSLSETGFSIPSADSSLTEGRFRCLVPFGAGLRSPDALG
eukprot:8197001-Heterocapsa_arctica.AAC.1